ncbi:TetR/AcrR family transcriptional regulator [Rhodococcus sp. D2-41]|uniref:TetR/AcrR family transcriptional regulator n=1 Tax=Speluncibacter jeojiensis TaxID=2710754 RepID=A0A9X4RED0_9ACTN|nr:ScbR family autoregulator-binding transcription factor [Rhodococcus sp. D2-41]MDG3010272.1 TetR/AcrR family transcriptional regulator [Rhodococcus sp. D2-41]MDG3015785.1 TetR/AcrR family transcriptional regulator [Corynebacteriales bacterium D3-21]
MVASKEPRAETTRRAILDSAADEFSRRGYSRVNISDIVAGAQVSKGALHFHFPSKLELAEAVIDEKRRLFREAVAETFTRRLSGLESVMDIFFATGRRFVENRMVQAGVRLTVEIGRDTDVLRDSQAEWTGVLGGLIERATVEGDVRGDHTPDGLSRILTSIMFGLGDYADPRDPARFLLDIQHAWELVLPGVVPADKLPYFVHLVQRRGRHEIRELTSSPVAIS